MYEHNWESTPKVWSNYARCIKETDDCPACRELGKEGTYEMIVTCIDLQPYTDSKGVPHKYSRKLLVVKTGMIPKYERLFKKNKNSFRGIMLNLFRDNALDPASGSSFEQIKVIPEALLAKYTDANKIADYAKAFPRPTVEELRLRFNQDRRQGAEDIEDTSGEAVFDDDDEDDLPF